MRVIFANSALKEYRAWEKSNPKTVAKIDELIEDILKNGLNEGLGKPEKLRHYKNPVRFSREINRSDRLVYFSDGQALFILSCKGHDGDH
ncbi:MAG: Txe/YoeB family addiction module toxin [Defluviitaleaceae bacterium]|nr:Txe/YoeB family addiction module toxin [Defluviitaleaceae bacterium]